MNWMKENNTAVITGGAGGIGLETGKRLASEGMNVVLVDVKELNEAKEELIKITQDESKVQVINCDVSSLKEVLLMKDEVFDKFDAVDCLMNNAGIAAPGSRPWEDIDGLKSILDINFMGVVNGCHAFIPQMLKQGTSGVVINTGSKQGITRPPGNYAYNLSKASVVAYTEALSHAFLTEENCALSAHLLIPAFVYTPMISAFIPDKPEFAATTEETVSFFLENLKKGDFYILCPDNETPRNIDEKRIQWMADDIIKNRPAMSRWHPDFEKEFKDFMES